VNAQSGAIEAAIPVKSNDPYAVYSPSLSAASGYRHNKDETIRSISDQRRILFKLPAAKAMIGLRFRDRHKVTMRSHKTFRRHRGARRKW
jgi:hypothetical protein